MLRGTSTQTIDNKNRITIPDRFMEKIKFCQEKYLVMTIINEEKCIFVYDCDQWNKLLKRVQDQNEYSEPERYMESVAVKCPVDTLNRVSIPHDFKEYAGLESAAVVSGMLEHFEIWSKTHWDQLKANLDLDGFADLSLSI